MPSFGRVELDVSPGTQTLREELEPDTPFRVAILGDFSGRANRGIFDPGSLPRRQPIPIDRDDFDLVMGGLGPALHLGAGVDMVFKELDDFHPDQIYDRCALFQKLREPPLSEPAPPQAAAPAGLLDAMLEETERRIPSTDDFADYLKAIVAPHLAPKPEPKPAGLDASLSEKMRAILHQPDFQALEAAWRAIFFLVRTLETGTQLKLYLIDASKAELTAGFTGISAPGGEPWAVLAGNYTFEPTREDVELLGRIAEVARGAGAPFLAAAAPGMLELAPEVEEAWEALRGMPAASSLGLALPRFLLRPPYGAGANTTERFDFEEMPAGVPPHESYLWANPAFACAFLLAMAFTEYGWDLRPGVFQEIENMPAHFYKEDGETRMKPCAEMLLTMDAAEKILDRGLMPLLSIKGRDAVRLARFQSIQKPAAPLAGRWA